MVVLMSVLRDSSRASTTASSPAAPVDVLPDATVVVPAAVVEAELGRVGVCVAVVVTVVVSSVTPSYRSSNSLPFKSLTINSGFAASAAFTFACVSASSSAKSSSLRVFAMIESPVPRTMPGLPALLLLLPLHHQHQRPCPLLLLPRLHPA